MVPVLDGAGGCGTGTFTLENLENWSRGAVVVGLRVGTGGVGVWGTGAGIGIGDEIESFLIRLLNKPEAPDEMFNDTLEEFWCRKRGMAELVVWEIDPVAAAWPWSNEGRRMEEAIVAATCGALGEVSTESIPGKRSCESCLKGIEYIILRAEGLGMIGIGVLRMGWLISGLPLLLKAPDALRIRLNGETTPAGPRMMLLVKSSELPLRTSALGLVNLLSLRCTWF